MNDAAVGAGRPPRRPGSKDWRTAQNQVGRRPPNSSVNGSRPEQTASLLLPLMLTWANSAVLRSSSSSASLDGAARPKRGGVNGVVHISRADADDGVAGSRAGFSWVSGLGRREVRPAGCQEGGARTACRPKAWAASAAAPPVCRRPPWRWQPRLVSEGKQAAPAATAAAAIRPGGDRLANSRRAISPAGRPSSQSGRRADECDALNTGPNPSAQDLRAMAYRSAGCRSSGVTSRVARNEVVGRRLSRCPAQA